MHRFADPTIYQASRTGLGQIGGSLVIELVDLQQLQDAEVEKNGAWIRYGLADDPLQGWRKYAAPMMTEVKRISDACHRAVVQDLATVAEGQRVAAEITDPVVGAAVDAAIAQLRRRQP